MTYFWMIITIITFWLGAYIFNFFHEFETWYGFPLFITAYGAWLFPAYQMTKRFMNE